MTCAPLGNIVLAQLGVRRAAGRRFRTRWGRHDLKDYFTACGSLARPADVRVQFRGRHDECQRVLSQKASTHHDTRYCRVHLNLHVSVIAIDVVGRIRHISVCDHYPTSPSEMIFQSLLRQFVNVGFQTTAVLNGNLLIFVQRHTASSWPQLHLALRYKYLESVSVDNPGGERCSLVRNIDILGRDRVLTISVRADVNKHFTFYQNNLSIPPTSIDCDLGARVERGVQPDSQRPGVLLAYCCLESADADGTRNQCARGAGDYEDCT